MNDLTYTEFINDILDARGRHGCVDAYYETHHILPKCCGGSDNRDNLIDLYASEHFIAHRLLAIENPTHSGLVYAWWNMCSCVCKDDKRRYQCTPEEYEEARIAFCKTMSEAQMGENNSFYGKHHTEATKQRQREASSGANNPNYGKPLSEEVKQKIGKANSGRVPSDETRAKLSVANGGENNPMFGKHHDEKAKEKMRQAKIGVFDGENNPMYGKHHTDETKDKIRIARTGTKDSDETKKKKSESRLGAKNPKAKAVFCIELNQYFGSTCEAARIVGVQQAGISRCCNGLQEHAGKHPQTGEKLHWIYANQVNNSSVV